MKNYLVYLNKFFFGGLIGFFGWAINSPLCVLSFLIMLGYFTEKRIHFFLIMLGYYLAASRGLLAGTIVYYKEYMFSFAVWFVAALIVSFAWVLLWGQKKTTKSIFFIITLIIITLPPVGLISWVNPLLASAYFFPGFGYFGILLYIAIIFLSIFFKKKFFFGVCIVCIGLLSSININAIKYKDIADFKTQFGELKEDDLLKSFKNQKSFLTLANNSEKNTILLAENALGFLNNSNMLVWGNLEDNKTVFAGATYQTETKKTDNVLALLRKDKYKIVYKQRVPVLFSMWKPWSDYGTTLNIFEKSVFEEDGVYFGVFICYEQLLLFTLLETMYYEPDVILAVSNLWWAKNTSIKKIENTNIELISILFNKPYSFAVNE